MSLAGGILAQDKIIVKTRPAQRYNTRPMEDSDT